MAEVRMASWNIEVYGPRKYGLSVNGPALVNLIAQLLAPSAPNVIVTMELMSSVSDQIAFNLSEAFTTAMGGRWEHAVVTARQGGDRESYGIHWRSDAAVVRFQPAEVAGNPVRGLANLDFPNNFSPTHGRRAAYMTFQTTDTRQFFTVVVYHAPANNNAVRGLQPIAQMMELYLLGGAAAGAPVNGRLIAGDFNLDVNVQPEYAWLRNPVPAPPPPAAAGQGAGCVEATRADTHLVSIRRAVNRWGQNLNAWGRTALEYRSRAAIDNVFYAPAAGAAGSNVIDVLQQVGTNAAVQAAIAANFQQFDRAGAPAFPNAQYLENLLPATLAQWPFAYVFTRYAVSDHLPVYQALNI